jgi:hypothetical protein
MSSETPRQIIEKLLNDNEHKKFSKNEIASLTHLDIRDVNEHTFELMRDEKVLMTKDKKGKKHYQHLP